MTNTNLLKSIMVLQGDEDYVAILVETLDISRPTASAKLNGKAKFDQEEIKILTDKYNLTGDQIKQIFVEGE